MSLSIPYPRIADSVHHNGAKLPADYFYYLGGAITESFELSAEIDRGLIYLQPLSDGVIQPTHGFARPKTRMVKSVVVENLMNGCVT